MATTTLPSLSTATGKSASGSTTKSASNSGSATGSSTTSSSKSTGLPKLSTSTTSSSSSSSISTPTITPPSAADNPNIWKSTLPSGTVFIAVAAVAGFIFLSFLCLILIKKLIAKRTAKKTLAIDSESSSSYGGYGGSTEKLSNNNGFYNTQNQSAVKIPLLAQQTNASTDQLPDTSLASEQNLYSTLDTEQNKRKSMFISPTAEVMNYNKNSRFLGMNNPLNQSSTGVGSIGPESIIYGGHNRENSSVIGSIPDLRHARNSSYDPSETASSTPNNSRSPQRGANRAHRTIPSAYLESMFED